MVAVVRRDGEVQKRAAIHHLSAGCGDASSGSGRCGHRHLSAREPGLHRCIRIDHHGEGFSRVPGKTVHLHFRNFVTVFRREGEGHLRAAIHGLWPMRGDAPVRAGQGLHDNLFPLKCRGNGFVLVRCHGEGIHSPPGDAVHSHIRNGVRSVRRDGIMLFRAVIHHLGSRGGDASA